MSGSTLMSPMVWANGGTAAFNPASLAWEIWVRGSFSSDPWTGVASAGGSGGRNLTEATNDPASGTAQNGFNPADFDGTNDRLGNATAMTTLLSTSAGTIAGVFKMDSIASGTGDPATYYQNPALVTDIGDGFTAVHVSTDGLGLGTFNGSNFYSLTIAFSDTASYHRFFARWNGTTLELKLDGGSWNTLSRTVSLSSGGFRLGANYNASAFTSVRMLEAMCGAFRISDGDATSLDSYFTTRYAI